MSGHSHARTVKRKKDADAAQRSKLFSKLANELSIAAKEGADPQSNSRLRIVIERARSFNMPTANIERAIQRGAGQGAGISLQEVLFEGYGPGGIAVLVEGITDNKNRTINEIKQVFDKNQGKLAGEGAVRWMFDRKGALVLPPQEQAKEELELLAIEAGAEDLYWREDGILELYTKPAEIEQVRTKLQEKGLTPESLSLDWVSKERVEISPQEKEAAERLFEALDENEAVQEIYANSKE
tara:strand:- start:1768 stop:2487 length:720 start_codon:yes stop_codon:yes gene_type:complete